MRWNENLTRFLPGAMLVAAVFAVGACEDGKNASLVEPVVEPEDLSYSEVTLSLSTSTFTAAPGEKITVALRVDGPVAVGGVEGSLRYDSSLLRYAGVIPEAGTPVVVNGRQAESGLLEVVSVNTEGFDGRNVGLFSFEVLAQGYDRGLKFDGKNVVSLGRELVDFSFENQIGQASLPATQGRHMSEDDWARFLDPSWRPAQRAATTPGIKGADIWGDAVPGGGINVQDVLAVAQINVNLKSCGKSDTEDCWAASVEPQNDGPNAGAGQCLPGYDDCTTLKRTINVQDVLAIAQDNVGNPDHPVAGESIPVPSTNPTRLDLVTAITGTPCSSQKEARTITGPVNLTNDHIWELGCSIRIGDPTGAAGTLTLEPGTRVEGKDTTSVLITTNGQIFAEGTPTQPILFTCVDDYSTPGTSPGVRAPGCWGGLYIAGNAKVNESDGAPASLAITGRTGAGAARRRAEGFDPADVYFGGDNDADNSGIIKYAIFAYGGFEVAEANELNNLTMGALGSGTTLEYVQTAFGSDDGFEWFGGRVSANHLVGIGNDDDTFDYSFGFDGDLQFLMAQLAPSSAALGDSDKAFEVDNNEDPSDPMFTIPDVGRTMARVWNVTVVAGDDSGTPNDKAYNYRRGAGSSLSNHLIVGAATVFDVDDNASCELVPGGDYYQATDDPATSNPSSGSTGPDPLTLEFARTLVLTTGTTSVTSSNCTGNDLTAFTDYIASQQTAGAIVVRPYANELNDPWDFLGPDFGVNPGVGLGLTGATPPLGLDQTATFIGAIDPSGGIPWYTGWTINGISGLTPGN